MITKEQLVSKLGKDGFRKFVLANKDKAPTGAERERGIKGRVKFRKCEHGTWVIENYEPRPCEGCHGESRSEVPAIHVSSYEYFNIGTGTYGTNQEHRKYAKRMGLREDG